MADLKVTPFDDIVDFVPRFRGRVYMKGERRSGTGLPDSVGGQVISKEVAEYITNNILTPSVSGSNALYEYRDFRKQRLCKSLRPEGNYLYRLYTLGAAIQAAGTWYPLVVSSPEGITRGDRGWLTVLNGAKKRVSVSARSATDTITFRVTIENPVTLADIGKPRLPLETEEFDIVVQTNPGDVDSDPLDSLIAPLSLYDVRPSPPGGGSPHVWSTISEGRFSYIGKLDGWVTSDSDRNLPSVVMQDISEDGSVCLLGVVNYDNFFDSLRVSNSREFLADRTTTFSYLVKVDLANKTHEIIDCTAVADLQLVRDDRPQHILDILPGVDRYELQFDTYMLNMSARFVGLGTDEFDTPLRSFDFLSRPVYPSDSEYTVTGPGSVKELTGTWPLQEDVLDVEGTYTVEVVIGARLVNGAVELSKSTLGLDVAGSVTVSLGVEGTVKTLRYVDGNGGPTIEENFGEVTVTSKVRYELDGTKSLQMSGMGVTQSRARSVRMVSEVDRSFVGKKVTASGDFYQGGEYPDQVFLTTPDGLPDQPCFVERFELTASADGAASALNYSDEIVVTEASTQCMFFRAPDRTLIHPLLPLSNFYTAPIGGTNQEGVAKNYERINISASADKVYFCVYGLRAGFKTSGFTAYSGAAACAMSFAESLDKSAGVDSSYELCVPFDAQYAAMEKIVPGIRASYPDTFLLSPDRPWYDFIVVYPVHDVATLFTRSEGMTGYFSLEDIPLLTYRGTIYDTGVFHFCELNPSHPDCQGYDGSLTWQYNKYFGD